VQRVAKDILTLTSILQIDLESGDSINDIAVKIADLVEPSSSPSDALRLAEEIGVLSENNAVERAAQGLQTALSYGELPALVDKGGMLERDGRINDALQPVLHAIAAFPEVYFALVSPRRPRLADGEPLPGVRLAELADSDMRRLIGLLARQRNLELSSEEIAGLSVTTRGYPPSARFAIDLAMHYGVPLASTQTGPATEFRMKPIRRYLRTLQLSPDARRTLRILAANSPLPLEVVIEATDGDIEGTTLVDLIDSSLVTPIRPPLSQYRSQDRRLGTSRRSTGGCDWTWRDLRRR
jgi:hypothetical protein